MIESILQLMRRDVTRGVAGTILLKVGSGALAFALFSLAARAMSPDAFGVFAAWLCVAQIGSVVGLVGQELVLVRFLNEYQVQERADLTKGVLLASLKISSIATLAVITVIAVGAVVKDYSGLLILSVAFFMIVNSGIMFGSQVARSLVSILMGEGNREFFWRILVVLFLAGLLFAHGQIDPTELFIVMAAAMLVGLIVQVISVLAALPDLSKVPARSETGRWNAQRGRAEAARGGGQGLANIGKLAQTRIVKLAAEVGLDLTGPGGTLSGPDGPDAGRFADAFVFAPASSIYGGTDEIQRNIVAERVLGLPREPRPDKGVPFSAVLRNGAGERS